jgi:hypothetical protein
MSVAAGWAAVSAYTVVVAPSLRAKGAAAVLMVVAWTGLQVVDRLGPPRYRCVDIGHCVGLDLGSDHQDVHDVMTSLSVPDLAGERWSLTRLGELFVLAWLNARGPVGPGHDERGEQ